MEKKMKTRIYLRIAKGKYILDTNKFIPYPQILVLFIFEMDIIVVDVNGVVRIGELVEK
jgi:hypothetical protein